MSASKQTGVTWYMDFPGRIHGWLYYLPRRYKKLVMLVVDAIALPIALLIAYAMRRGLEPTAAMVDFPTSFYWLTPILALPILYSFGIYRSMVRYQGIFNAAFATVAMFVVALTLAGANFIIELDMPRGVFVIFWLLGSMYIAASRFAARVFLTWGLRRQNEREPVVIFGAGSSGYQLASSLQGSVEYGPVAFVDDKRSLQGTVIQNLPVLSRKELKSYVKKHPVKAVLLAIPRASRAERLDAVSFLNQLPN